jgi:hypothetical protein
MPLGVSPPAASRSASAQAGDFANGIRVVFVVDGAGRGMLPGEGAVG